MEQYISKSALVAEIERRREESWLGHYTKEKGIAFDITDDVLSFIDTLEVIEIGVDAGSPEGDLGRKTVQVIDADGNISEVTFNKTQK